MLNRVDDVVQLEGIDQPIDGEAVVVFKSAIPISQHVVDLSVDATYSAIAFGHFKRGSFVLDVASPDLRLTAVMFSSRNRIPSDLVANVSTPLDQGALDGVALQLPQRHRLMVLGRFL